MNYIWALGHTLPNACIMFGNSLVYPIPGSLLALGTYGLDKFVYELMVSILCTIGTVYTYWIDIFVSILLILRDVIRIQRHTM